MISILQQVGMIQMPKQIDRIFSAIFWQQVEVEFDSIHLCRLSEKHF